MAGYITLDIQTAHVLSELSDDDLIRDVLGRNLIPGNFSLTEDIENAAGTGRAWDLLFAVQAALGMNCSLRAGAGYETLPRDPETGRPVIQ